MRVSARHRESRRSRQGSLGVRLLLGAVLVAACGDYDPETAPLAGGAGQMSTTGGLNPAEQSGMGGGGSNAMGGSGQSATGGNGGASGTGGSAQSATAGGSSANAGGSMGDAAPTVPMVEADCDDVTPCGGDVVGTWVVAGSCLPVSGMADMTGFGLGCTAAPVTGSLEVTGMWTANADGTFTDQTITSGDSQIDLPAGCLNVSGTTTTCDRLGGALQALGYSLVTCVDAASGAGCACSALAEQTGGLATLALGAAQSGTYATANNVLTTTASSSSAYAYCVTGNTLVMTPQTLGKTGTLTGTVVLVKP